jgi:hypothetical protein
MYRRQYVIVGEQRVNWGYENSGLDCQFQNFQEIVVAIWGGYRRYEIKEWMIKNRHEEQLKWLGQKIRIGEMECSKASEMVMLFG